VLRHKRDAGCAIAGTSSKMPARLLRQTRTDALPPSDDLLTLRQAHDCAVPSDAVLAGGRAGMEVARSVRVRMTPTVRVP